MRKIHSFPEKLSFTSNIRWEHDKIGWLSTGNHEEEIRYGCPIPFGGEKGRLTPEGLFISSITACMASTILHLSDRFHFKPLRLEVNSEGIIKQKDNTGVFFFESVVVNINFDGDEEDEYILERISSLAPKYCLVVKSINIDVEYRFILNGQLFDPTKDE